MSKLPATQSNAVVNNNRPIVLSANPHAFEGAVLSPKHARELTPSLCLAITSALSEQAYRKNAIPYTLWITEAWRVLGWAEPSAALFWEMATMYHTLYLAGKEYAQNYIAEHASHIPPILSCGSQSSLGSGNTTPNPNAQQDSHKKRLSTSVSAKELPVWLVGTFLLLHCEESAFLRNVSGQDESRFYGNSVALLGGANTTGKVDFTTLLKHPGLSPRTRIHAGCLSDNNSNCIAYLLRHLRKILLLSAVSHNPDAVRACMHLAAIPSPSSPPPTKKAITQHSSEEIRRQHDEEHGNVGVDVRLTMEDLEKLHFCLQRPSGGAVDDPPLKIGSVIWSTLFSSPALPTSTISVADAEREIRRQLNIELVMAGQDDEENSSPSDASHSDDEAVAAISNLSIGDAEKKDGEAKAGRSGRPKQLAQGSKKQLSYTHVRGTTILLKPNSHYRERETGGVSSAASTSSVDNAVGAKRQPSGSSRLHDMTICDCSDAHIYLLQPFEHVTIAACSGCTIVVGAVAGLLHVVDCEKTTITSTARRILLSNSFDVLLCSFTPSPPLLVGDNRNCQFAPYNTYYDGLREDLLATGLAASAVPDLHSPQNTPRPQDNDVVWPPLKLASNKWKLPVEVAKLEMPQVQSSGAISPTGSVSSTGSSGSLGEDDKAVSNRKDDSMLTPILLPASEFNVLFVPFESESSKQQRLEREEQERVAAAEDESGGTGIESQYVRNLAELLQYSPFRLPVEYERRALEKAERVKNIQQAMQKNLTKEQQKKLEEELNRGFRDWLVTSGNLRQVLDLVHMERRMR